jgi:hypothetical protein
MITRHKLMQARAEHCEKLEREYPDTLYLISWRQPNPKKHPRFFRRQVAECQFNWIESSKGMVIN